MILETFLNVGRTFSQKQPIHNPGLLAQMIEIAFGYQPKADTTTTKEYNPSGDRVKLARLLVEERRLKEKLRKRYGANVRAGDIMLHDSDAIRLVEMIGEKTRLKMI